MYSVVLETLITCKYFWTAICNAMPNLIYTKTLGFSSLFYHQV